MTPNPTQTIDNLVDKVKQDQKDLLTKAKFAESNLLVNIGNYIQSNNNGTLTTSVLSRQSANYNNDIAEGVKDVIDTFYDFSNEANPLHGIVNTDAVTNPLLNGLLQEVLMPDKKSIMDLIGKDNFDRSFEYAFSENNKALQQKFPKIGMERLNVSQNKEGYADYLKSQYNLQNTDVDRPTIIGSAENLMARHMYYGLDRTGLIDEAPRRSDISIHQTLPPNL